MKKSSHQFSKIHIVWKSRKMSHLRFQLWHFPSIFVLLEITFCMIFNFNFSTFFIVVRSKVLMRSLFECELYRRLQTKKYGIKKAEKYTYLVYFLQKWYAFHWCRLLVSRCTTNVYPKSEPEKEIWTKLKLRQNWKFDLIENWTKWTELKSRTKLIKSDKKK